MASKSEDKTEYVQNEINRIDSRNTLNGRP